MRLSKTVALIVCSLSVRASTSDASQLEQRVRELERIVAGLQQRLESMDARGNAAPVATVATPALPATTATPVPTAAAPAAAETRPRINLGGEFRVYFDSITRPAGGGAPRASNIRGRYLLHLVADATIRKDLSIHARLSSGPLNNPLTDIQDFGAGVAKQMISIAEAYADYHPNRAVTLQAGRVDNPFNDRTRFLFDIDTRFNGTNEIFRIPVAKNGLGIEGVTIMGGQYTFSNPNFPIIAPGDASTASSATASQAFLAAGAVAGTQPRASQLFQEGAIVRQKSGWLTQDFQADFQSYRNPNQLRLMSTPAGSFLIGSTIGVVPSGTIPSPSNATTTPNGATLTAPGFRILHGQYTIGAPSFRAFNRAQPLSLNLQWARNMEPVSDRTAWSAIFAVGQSREKGDVRASYGYYMKGANSLIGELTENDIAIGGNVNMRANLLRVEYTIVPRVVFANNFIWTKWLKDSNPGANFFVPLGSRVPGQLRYQSMLIFRF